MKPRNKTNPALDALLIFAVIGIGAVLLFGLPGDRAAEIRRLKMQLDEAVSREDYEKAIVLRDSIHALERELKQSKPEATK